MPIWCFVWGKCQGIHQITFSINTDQARERVGSPCEEPRYKAGSEEFHALKNGHDLYDDKNMGGSKGKDKSKGKGKKQK